MSVSAVKRQQPPADPLRQALVDALADLATAKQKVENHATATRKTWRALHDAQANAAKAEKGITTARVDAATVLADVATDDDDDVVPPPNTVSLARAAHADALDTIENLKAARDQLRRTLPDLEADVRAADVAVDAAISKLLCEPVQLLIDRLRTLISQSTPIRRQLNDLLDAHRYNNFGFGALAPLEQQLDTARSIVMRHSDADIDKVAGEFAAIRGRLRADPHCDIEWPGG